MSDTRVSVLTPSGTGAIATVAVVGPGAWDAVRTHFRPANGKPLPESPTLRRFWFGKLGDTAADEVVVAVVQVEPEPAIEIHCHGGRRVVRWVVELFLALRCMEVHPSLTLPSRNESDARALEPLTRAPTLRTAAIVLDQLHGAFRHAITNILANPTSEALVELLRFAAVGRHLVEPWRVVVAGPPNVGKSSLINALAGYQRSVVSPTAGTTRDVVTVTVSLDGWPVELSDTAGLRDAVEPLESEGIDRARRSLAGADRVVWVLDGSDPHPVWPPSDLVEPLLVVSKSDLPRAWEPPLGCRVFPVSATTGEGVAELASELAHNLVPDPPSPGSAVPFTPALADAIALAATALADGATARARTILMACVPGCAEPPLAE